MAANLVDIKGIDITKIPENEVFAIDTNVLIWTHYSKASNPNLRTHPYQVIEYPNFVAKLLVNGNKIITTNLNITELVNVVEKNQYRIYKAINNQKSLKFKDYRNIVAERQEYKKEIDAMMLEIKAIYGSQVEIIEISDEKIQEFQKNIYNNKCDVFDYIIINYLKEKGIKNYISDDKDFLTIEDINLYSTYDN